MNWAISVVISEEETIETRLQALVSYVIANNHVEHFFIDHIDATGYTGNQITQRLNIQNKRLEISTKELLALMSEDGQIFDLDLVLSNSFKFRFIISDGYYLEIVSNGQRLPDSVVGPYNELDLSLFPDF